MNADDTLITLAWFPTAMPDGPAYGDAEETVWSEFCGVLWLRRHGPKDDGVGRGFVGARLKLEDDGKHVRRQKKNVLARTLIVLDIETSKKTGEVPPALDELAEKIRAHGWTAAIWTSHSHTPDDIRYRVVLLLSREIDHELPVVEIVARDC
jgi:hypothetical protein